MTTCQADEKLRDAVQALVIEEGSLAQRVQRAMQSLASLEQLPPDDAINENWAKIRASDDARERATLILALSRAVHHWRNLRGKWVRLG